MNLRAAAGVVGIGLAGVALGAVGSHWAHRAWGRGGPGTMESRMLSRLSRELRLDGGQQERVSALLAEARASVDAVRRETRPRYEAIREATEAKIREALRPDQLEAFDRFRDRERARMEKRRLDRGETLSGPEKAP